MLLNNPSRFGSSWTPRNIPECVAWWDSQDASSITKSGSEVTAWEDQISALTLVNDVNGPETLSPGGLTMMSFVGANTQRLKISGESVLDPGSDDVSYCVVYRTGNHIASGCLFGKTGGGDPDYNYGFFVNVNADGSLQFTMNDDVGANTLDLEDTSKDYSDNVTRYSLMTYDDSADDGLLYIDDLGDGNEVTSDLAYVSNAISPTNDFYVGSIDGSGNFFTGQVGEIMVFNKVLSTADKASLEAYIKNRWLLNPFTVDPGLPGIVASGVTGHYSSWDAADYTLVSGEVTVLADKSGNGNDLTPGAGTGPTLVSVNGHNWLAFESSTPTLMEGNNTDIDPGHGDFSIFILFRADSTAGETDGLLLKQVDGNEYFGYLVNFTNDRSLRWAMNDTIIFNTLALDDDDAARDYVDGTPKISMFTYDDSIADALMYNHNTGMTVQQDLVYASVEITPDPLLKLGGWVDVSELNLDGDIAEVIFWDRPLTTTDLDCLRLYMTRKWNLDH